MHLDMGKPRERPFGHVLEWCLRSLVISKDFYFFGQVQSLVCAFDISSLGVTSRASSEATKTWVPCGSPCGSLWVHVQLENAQGMASPVA